MLVLVCSEGHPLQFLSEGSVVGSVCSGSTVYCSPGSHLKFERFLLYVGSSFISIGSLVA